MVTSCWTTSNEEIWDQLMIIARPNVRGPRRYQRQDGGRRQFVPPVIRFSMQRLCHARGMVDTLMRAARMRKMSTSHSALLVLACLRVGLILRYLLEPCLFKSRQFNFRRLLTTQKIIASLYYTKSSGHSDFNHIALCSTQSSFISYFQATE
jgi:hypothetical protein